MKNKMFNKILIVHNERKTNENPDALNEVIKVLNKLHKDFLIVNLASLKKNHFNFIDLVLTLGGDGTFITASHYLDETPIIGINSNKKTSEGFLTELNNEQIHLLEDILNGNHEVIKRQRAALKINGELVDKHALCEIYVGAEKQFHTARYILKLGEEEEEHRSSGIIVVTGSGSTAWYKSAGGDPFHHEEKRLKFLVREPYTGENLFKPKMLAGEIPHKEKISIESKRYQGGMVALDCHLTFPFNLGDKVEIVLSDKPLKVVRRKNGL
ncbi:MAG: NAD(+)/NADH kinase [archaeon]